MGSRVREEEEGRDEGAGKSVEGDVEGMDKRKTHWGH